MESYIFIYIQQTDGAISVYEIDPNTCIQLPKSQINFDEFKVNSIIVGDAIEIEIPDWLAEEKGLS